MRRDRSIGRAGNPSARTTLIQLAWLGCVISLAARFPTGSVAAWERCKGARRIAIVAMVRKPLIALCRYVETGVLPGGVELRTMEEATA